VGGIYFVKMETILDFKVCHVLLAYLTLYVHVSGCFSTELVIAERSEATNLDDGSPILS